MSENYYKPCKEFDECNKLFEKYFSTKQYKKCFDGHLKLAINGQPEALEKCWTLGVTL